jgi:DNA-directed RNA polymerase subunit RPC12/RpoP
MIPMKLIYPKKPKINSPDRYAIKAHVINVGEDILTIDIYKYNQTNVDKMQLPKYRLFISDREDMVYEVNSREWYQRKLEGIIGKQWCYSVDDYFDLLDDESEQIIKGYLPEDRRERRWTRLVQDRQEHFRSEKSRKVYEGRVKRINEKMKYIDSLMIPCDFMEFVDSSFSELRYAFYKTVGKRSVEVICSHCKTKHIIDITKDGRPKHNEYGICSNCGSRVMFKSPGRVLEIQERKEIILMLKTKDGFVSRYYDARRMSSPYGEEYSLTEKARVIYNGKRTWTYYNSNGYSEQKNISWWDRTGGYGNIRVVYGAGSLYYNNLDDVLNDTAFKYCAIKLLAEHKPGMVINQECFFLRFEGARFIEYFIKMGLYNLTNDYVKHFYSNEINRYGKNMIEILRITKQQVNRLIEMDGDLYALRLLQTEENRSVKFTDDQIMFFSENHLRMDQLEVVLQYTSPTQVVKFLKVKREYKSIDRVLTEWIDYIENSKLLGYDLENEFVLFPKHLKSAHDRAAQAAVDMINREKDKKLQDKMNAIRDKYYFESKNFMIRIPQTTGEIIKEGQDLHHCVGTYVERVVRGECIILFVRRKDDIETSFFTMEIKNNEVVQCRGKNNCDMPQPVKQFVESFKEQKLNCEQTHKEAEDNVA